MTMAFWAWDFGRNHHFDPSGGRERDREGSGVVWRSGARPADGVPGMSRGRSGYGGAQLVEICQGTIVRLITT
jgi:hypothetical protein